jgi:hypothetical protein
MDDERDRRLSKIINCSSRAERVFDVASNGDPTTKTNTFAVFAKDEINARLRLAVDDPKGLVITPLLHREKAIDADSVDLRLGTYFLLPRALPEPYFSPDENTATLLHLKVHVPLGRYLVVPAHQTVLGSTLEPRRRNLWVTGTFRIAGEGRAASMAKTMRIMETAPLSFLARFLSNEFDAGFESDNAKSRADHTRRWPETSFFTNAAGARRGVDVLFS